MEDVRNEEVQEERTSDDEFPEEQVLEEEVQNEEIDQEEEIQEEKEDEEQEASYNLTTGREDVTESHEERSARRSDRARRAPTRFADEQRRYYGPK